MSDASQPTPDSSTTAAAVPLPPDRPSDLVRVGKVYLVGAGPGDPGLITVRGRELLAQADLVLYDGLVNPLLLRWTEAAAERTSRCKDAGRDFLDQPAVIQRMISAARSGQTVIRLKGGDPFVFGRGSEEAAALVAAGIEFEVVPGITAAVAASAYAGISVTHRDYASAVAFLTGHETPGKSESSLDYPALARFPGTLVFYMGLHRLPEIVSALIASGKDPHTPAAVICRGTTPAQRTVSADLIDLPAQVQAAGLHPPSLIIVGDCVRLRESLQWYDRLPLFGQRIGVTRPVDQAGPVIDRLLQLGAQPVLMPTIEIRPVEDWTAVDDCLSRLPTYDWLVFTSANGVQAFTDRLMQTGRDWRSLGRIQIAVIGEATARALAERGIRADLIPPEFRAESLAAVLRPVVAGGRVLWAKASRGRDVLPTELRQAGAVVDEVVTYQNRDLAAWSPDVVAALERGELEWIALSSPSIARRVAELLPPSCRSRLGQTLRIASISPVTSAAAQAAGLPISAEARVFTWEGLIDAIQSAGPAGSSGLEN